MSNFNDRREERKSYRMMNNGGDNKKWTGLFLLGIGVIYLLRQMDFPIPYWVFSWEMILIAIGLFIGIRHNFRGAAWFILILIGSVSMIDNIFPFYNLRHYAWPLILIIAGLFFILRPKRPRTDNDNLNDKGFDFVETKTEPVSSANNNYSNEDWVDATAIFGGVKKVIVSKNFKGGDITAIMGGVELNLSQADFNGKIFLDATNFMGGTKLIIPPTWDVKSEMVAIFGGVEDKRDIRSLTIDPNKLLVIDGTCIFGGLEIRNY